MTETKEAKLNRKYIFLGIIAILIILSYLIIRPFIIQLISAFILAYLARPLFTKLKKKMPKSLAAILAILAVILIIIIPISVIITGIITQLSTLSTASIKSWLIAISETPIFQTLNINLETALDATKSILLTSLKSTLTQLPTFIINTIVILLGVYYMLTQWDKLALKLKNYLPFKDKAKVINDISQTTNKIMYGTILIAVIQFIIGTLGFYIAGIKPYLLLGVLVFFFAFIPALGPAIIWIPTAIVLALLGNLFALIIVIVTGLILSIFCDAVLRAKLLGKKTNVNPFVMLVSILGGIAVFGVFGFIIGPLIIIYTLKLLDATVSGKEI